MTTTSPYDSLAPIYDEAGFSNYGAMMASKMLTFLQQQGWIGRRILELGSGTGTGVAFFAERAMTVTGMDSSSEMHRIAEQRMMDRNFDYRLILQDVRQGGYPDELDLVFTMGNLLNELGSLREVELVLKHCYDALLPGKLLVFDMSTIKGLVEYFGNQEQQLDLGDNLFVSVQNTFSYETLSVQQRVMAFQHNGDELWRRITAITALRAYPFSAISRSLEKVGFSLEGAFYSNLSPFDPSEDREGRFIAIARRAE